MREGCRQLSGMQPPPSTPVGGKENAAPFTPAAAVARTPGCDTLPVPPTSVRRRSWEGAVELLLADAPSSVEGGDTARRRRAELLSAVRAEHESGGAGSWLSLLQFEEAALARALSPRPAAAAALTRLYELAARTLPRANRSRDEPFLRVWLGLAARQAAGGGTGVEDARDTFKFLRSQRLGDSLALLWLAWAAFEDRCGRRDKAAAVLAKALSHGAGPVEELEAATTALQRNLPLPPLPEPPHPGGEGGAAADTLSLLPCAVTPWHPQLDAGTGLLGGGVTGSTSTSASGSSTRSSGAMTATVTTATGALTASGSAIAASRGDSRSVASAVAPAAPQPLASTPAHAASQQASRVAASGASRSQSMPVAASTPAPRGSAVKPPLPPAPAPVAVEAAQPAVVVAAAAAPPAGSVGTLRRALGAPRQDPAPAPVQEAAAAPTFAPPPPAPAAAVSAPPASRAPAPEVPARTAEREQAPAAEAAASQVPLPSAPPAPPIAAPPPPAAASMAPPPALSAEEAAARAKARAAQQLAAQQRPSGGAAPAASAPPRMREDDTFVYVRGVRYTKLECVGQGGTCKVFKVITQSRRILAVKRIRLQGAQAREEAIVNFLEEIQLLESLRGRANIIQLAESEVIREEGLIYLVLEFGETDLAQLLARRATARAQRTGGAEQDSVQARCADNQNFLRLYFQQMVEAVATIHEARIVHADLKPANFLIVEGALKLIDFGIAKAIGESKAHDTTNIVREHQVGTINYMSPEAVLNGAASSNGRALKIGRASDIWSLGCILYQMVYGATPFSSITQLLPKLHAIANPNYPIPFPPTGSAALEDLMQRALERDPLRRITIPEILVHPFIRPSSASSSPPLLTEAVLADALLRCAQSGAGMQPHGARELARALLAGQQADWSAAFPGEGAPR